MLLCTHHPPLASYPLEMSWLNLLKPLHKGKSLQASKQLTLKSQIRDSNRSMLISALLSESRGIKPVDLGIAPDTFEQLEAAIMQSLGKGHERLSLNLW